MIITEALLKASIYGLTSGLAVVALAATAIPEPTSIPSIMLFGASTLVGAGISYGMLTGRVTSSHRRIDDMSRRIDDTQVTFLRELSYVRTTLDNVNSHMTDSDKLMTDVRIEMRGFKKERSNESV